MALGIIAFGKGSNKSKQLMLCFFIAIYLPQIIGVAYLGSEYWGSK
jgi:hypothetical protein